MPVLRRLGCSVLALGLLAGCAPPRTGPASSPTNNGAKADAVIRIVRDFMTQAHLKAVRSAATECEPPRAHGRASRPADRGGPLVGPYGPPGRSQNATHNAQAGIDTHCSCPSAVRSQYIGPGFPQSFAPSGEHG